GQGTTLALDGVAVVATDQQADNVGTLAVIDMAGPNAELSAFGRTHNLVISAWPTPGAERSDYLAAVRHAALKAAVCLARTAREAKPDRVERSEEHTSELQSLTNLVCRLLLEKKKRTTQSVTIVPCSG